MNNKGSSITSWVFGILTILLLLVIIQSQVLTPMNSIYNKSYETGLNTSAIDDFDRIRGTGNSEVEGGEVSQTSDGLTLLSSWSMIKGIYRTLTDFIGGGFINNLFTDILDFPPIFASVFIIMMWISLILIIVYIFMKVVP